MHYYVYASITFCLNQVLAKVSPFVLREMKHYKIIPDLMESPPRFGVQVEFSGESADFGNSLRPYQVANEPTESFWPADKNKLYSMLLLDLDAPRPDNPHLREYLHWLVVNIPEDRFQEGQCLAPYIGVTPSDAEGEHRYVFLVFEQPEEMEFHEITKKSAPSDKLRGKFSWRMFAKKYNLGYPFAINFFRAEKAGPMDPGLSKKQQKDNSDSGGWFFF